MLDEHVVEPTVILLYSKQYEHCGLENHMILSRTCSKKAVQISNGSLDGVIMCS